MDGQIQEVHSSSLSVVLDTFSAPFPDYLPLAKFYSFRGHLRYQLECELVFIYYSSKAEAIHPLINLSSMRNARVYSFDSTSSVFSQESGPTFETESVNIITISLRSSQNFNILNA